MAPGVVLDLRDLEVGDDDRLHQPRFGVKMLNAIQSTRVRDRIFPLRYNSR